MVGIAEITSHSAGEKVDILNRERPVKPHLVTECLDLLWRSVEGQKDRYRVSTEVHEQENDDRDPKEDQHSVESTL